MQKIQIRLTVMTTVAMVVLNLSDPCCAHEIDDEPDRPRNEKKDIYAESNCPECEIFDGKNCVPDPRKQLPPNTPSTGKECCGGTPVPVGFMCCEGLIYDPNPSMKLSGQATIPGVLFRQCNDFVVKKLGFGFEEPPSLSAVVYGADCCNDKNRLIKFESELLGAAKDAGIVEAGYELTFTIVAREKPVVLPPPLPPLGITNKIPIPWKPGRSAYLKYSLGLFFSMKIGPELVGSYQVNTCSNYSCWDFAVSFDFTPSLDLRVEALFCETIDHIKNSEACEGVGIKGGVDSEFTFSLGLNCKGVTGGIYMGPSVIYAEVFFLKEFIPPMRVDLVELDSKVRIF